jgi:probable phosphoglycerate mutase
MADNEQGELLICRHGETPWSLSGQHTGVTDMPLTEIGRAQARALRPILANRADRLRHVLVSPLSRAMDTAALAGVDTETVTDELAEWNYGDYEGLTTEEIRRDRPGWTIWNGDPPGGETAADVRARADRLLERIAELRRDGDVLVVGHGHFSRVLAARYLHLPVASGALLRLDPATLCVLGVEHESPTIVRWNLPGPNHDGRQ